MATNQDRMEQLRSQRQRVDVDNIDFSVGELFRMAIEQVLMRAPVYQRKFRWDDTRESQLIESLMLGLPIPPIYVASNDDGTWEVVDGLQRLSTLIHFMDTERELLGSIGKSKPLTLAGLEKLTKFNGSTFEDFPAELRLRFPRSVMRVTALSDKSDKAVRYDIFQRLNRGGISLSEQEVRAAVFRGRFAKFLRRLASNSTFNKLLKLQASKKNDGTKEEVVLKFFAYLWNRDRFKGSVRDFLNAYMKQSMKAGAFDYEHAEALFTEVCSAVSDRINPPFLRTNTRTTPLNEFEAVLVAAGTLLEDNVEMAYPEEEWLDDEELVQHSTKGTNTPAALRGRIDRAIQLLSVKD